MKVFVSCSGPLSHRVAVRLRDWLPSVIQSLEPYVSSEDIDKGARWSTDIAQELEDSSYGILCVTKENLDAPWLNFEAGALSKSIDRSRVSPFLFGVKRSEVKGPILQFQSTVFEKDDVKKLVIGLNGAEQTNSLDETRLDQIFEVWWPQLESALEEIQVPGASELADAEASSPNSEIMEEVLELVRQQHRLLNSPDSLLPKNYLRQILRGARSGAPEAGHPVYPELAKGLQEFETLLEKFEGTDEVLISVVIERSRDLQDAVSYILRRTGPTSARDWRRVNLRPTEEG